MAILNKVLFSQFMHHNGRPLIAPKADEGLGPALEQMFAKRAEWVIEITVSIQLFL